MKGKSTNVPLIPRRIHHRLDLFTIDQTSKVSIGHDGLWKAVKKEAEVISKISFYSSYQMQLNHLKKLRQSTNLVHTTT